jgi:hypothetical protein
MSFAQTGSSGGRPGSMMARTGGSQTGMTHEQQLPAYTSIDAQQAGRHSADALEQALDMHYRSGQPLLGSYEVLGPNQRAAGGQGVVQFVRQMGSGEEFAIKFFTHEPAFEAERVLYENSELRPMMPATREIISNKDGRNSIQGYTFPPCIVQERGESLEAWAEHEDPDFITVLQVPLSHTISTLLLHCETALHITNREMASVFRSQGWCSVGWPGCMAEA